MEIKNISEENSNSRVSLVGRVRTVLKPDNRFDLQGTLEHPEDRTENIQYRIVKGSSVNGLQKGKVYKFENVKVNNPNLIILDRKSEASKI